MEQVLTLYTRAYDSRYPVICMDEMPKQLLGEVRPQIPMKPGRTVREDYEYRRNGTCNIFIANEPLQGKRFVAVCRGKKRSDWAKFMRTVAEKYSAAEKIILVMDNLNTHSFGSFYETFPPEEAKCLMERFKIVHTPKHGSWLNMAEIELNVLNGQCLKRRIPDMATMEQEVTAWAKERNSENSAVNWQFKTEDARVKLAHLYPKL